MDQVEEVKSKVDIVEFVSEYVPLKKAGRNFKGSCPFHGEKTPSFMVNPELQIFKCFGCGVGGDAFVFLEKMEGMEFGEALKTLAKRVGVTLTSYKPTQAEEFREKLFRINGLAADYFHYLLTEHKLGKAAGEYLNGRGITDQAIKKYKLGFAPDGWDFLGKFLIGKKGFSMEELQKSGLVVEGRNYDRFRNRIMFPLNNHRGQVVGFAGRVMPGVDEAAGGKYVNTPETEIYHKGNLLYGLDLNKTEIKTTRFAVVVEGEIDAIASWLTGVKNVVAIKGSALTLQQVDLLRRFTDTLVLGLDADTAGDMAARRGIEIAQKEGMIIKVINSKSEEVNPKHFKDPGDWGIGDPEGWKKAVAGAIPIYDFFIESAVGRHGLDVVGKTRVGRELLPILAGIDDEIMKSHYVKKLAGILGVDDQAVWGQMMKITNLKLPITNKLHNSNDEKAGVKSRRELVEEYVVGMAVRAGKLEKLERLLEEGFLKTKFWRRVVEELGRVKKVKGLPEELRKRVEELVLVEEDLDEAGWEKEWKKQINLLELVGVGEEMTEIMGNEGGEVGQNRLKDLVTKKGELTRGR